MPSFFSSSREGNTGTDPNRLRKTTKTIGSARASTSDEPITTSTAPTEVAKMQRHRSILKKSKTVATGEEEGSSQPAEPRRSFVSFTRPSRASTISVASSTATITKDNYKSNASSNTKLQRSESWKRRFGLNNILTRGGSSTGGGGKNRSSTTTTTASNTFPSSSSSSPSPGSGSTSTEAPTTTTTQGNVSIGDESRHQSAGVNGPVGIPVAQGQIHHLHPSSNRSSISSARPAVTRNSPSSLSVAERLSKPRQSQTTTSTLKRTPSPSSLAVVSTTATSSRSRASSSSTSSRPPLGSARKSTATSTTTKANNNNNNNTKSPSRLVVRPKAALLPPIAASPPLELSLPLPDTANNIDLVPTQSTTEIVQTEKNEVEEESDNKNTTSKPLTTISTNTSEEMPTTTTTVTTTTVTKSMPPIIPDTLTVDTQHPAMATTSAKFTTRTSSLPQSTATGSNTTNFSSHIDLSKSNTELSTQLSYYITPSTTPTPDALTATASLPPSVMRPGPSTPPLTEDSISSKSSTKLSIRTNTGPYSHGPPTPASSSTSSTNLPVGKRVNFADLNSSSPAPPRQQRPANFQRPPQRPPSPIHIPAPDLTKHTWVPLRTIQLDCAANHTWASFRNKQHSILCAICRAMEFEGRGVPVKKSYYCTWCAVRLCGGCKDNLGNCEGGLRELWEKMEETREENIVAIKEGRGMESSRVVVRVEKEKKAVASPPPEPKGPTAGYRGNTTPVQGQRQGQRRLPIEAVPPPPPPPVQRISSMPPPQRLNTKSPRPTQPPQSQTRQQPTRPRQASSNVLPPPRQQSRTPPRLQSRTPPPQSRTQQPQSTPQQRQSVTTTSKAPQLPETYRITPVESESKPATVVLVEKEKASSITAASLKDKKRSWFRGFGKKKEET